VKTLYTFVENSRCCVIILIIYRELPFWNQSLFIY